MSEIAAGELGPAVHQPLVAIDQLLLVQGHEHLAHRRRKALVQGEALAAPVAGGAQPAQLVGDGPAALGLPFPDPGDESLAAHVPAADIAGRGELALHHHLGGDAGMVGARQPERGLTLHPRETRQDILQGIVERMADMQRAGDIGRRNNDGEGLGGRIVDGREAARRLPLGVEAWFGGLGIEGFFKHAGAGAYRAGARRGSADAPVSRAGNELAGQLES